MNNKSRNRLLFSRELIFQLILHLVVFAFYIYDRHQLKVEAHQPVYFLNFALGALVVNYLLLPRFFYQNKYLQFAVLALLTILAVFLVEELILEKIYFPETKGRTFRSPLYSMMGIFPVIVILSGFKFAWDALQKQREVDELRATVEKSELQLLKSQINPHFLFNNLNNLYSYAIENSPKTPSIILELSAVLRYMLYECKEQYVLLSKEVEQLKNFTLLNELQIEDRGEVKFNSPEISSDYQVAPLILIVFIENAFKHSQACQSDNIRINIDIQLSDEGLLDFRCSNSYSTQNNTENLPHGIGLENVKKHLELLYPGNHKLDTMETGSSFEVHLSMQLSKAL